MHGLQHESDRKREELRSLVGERYRDLMDAAETIICMRKTSSEAVEQIKTVQDATVHVSKMNQSMGTSKNKFKSEFEEEAQYALAAQIKLLMDIPERIWASVDSQQYLIATKMFLFARHIHTNLSLNDEILNSYPVIERQWAAISHFYESICQGCDQVVASGTSSTQETLDAMTALTLLRGSKPKNVFDDLLKKRKSDLNLKLKRKDVSAKAHICHSLKSMSILLETVYECFYQESLKQRLDQISHEQIVVLLHASAESPVMNFLPSIIRDFKPKITTTQDVDNSSSIEIIDHSYVSKECKTWLDEVYEILTKETSIILSHVHNIVGLSNIRKSVHTFMTTEPLTKSCWSQLCQKLLGHSLNLWDEYYMHLFRDRIEAIISTYVAKSIYYLQSSLVSLPKDCLVMDYMMSEAGLNDSKVNNLLTLKARAFTPNVQEICKYFNDMLETTICDLKEYVDCGNINKEESQPKFSDYFTSDENKNETKEPFALDSDNEFILKCVQKGIIANMDEFMQYLTNQENLSSVATGRLLQALPDLCPALKTCVLAPKLLITQKDDFTFNHTKITTKVDPEWQNLNNKFDQIADKLFIKWVDEIIEILERDIAQGLLNTPEHNMQIIPTWDSIEICEEGEEGTIKSTIRVPQHLSVNAFQSLMNFSQNTSQIGPHSLPSKAQLALTQKAAMAFCKAYQSFCHVNEKITQNVALQLYFDLLFVNNAMINRENQDLINASKDAIAGLEQHIDPFDLSVFTPYMTSHAKRVVLRHQALFSVIIPPDRYSLLASMKSSIPATPNSRTLQNGHDQHEHNVIQLSSTCSRFVLLPITTKRGRETRIRGANTLAVSNLPSTTSASVTPSNNSARKRSKSPVARTANSFFEVMSSSWFGSK